MSIRNRMLPLPLASLAGSSLTGSYVAINPNGFPFPIQILRMVNHSSENILISYDGINDHDFLLAGDTLFINFEANAMPKPMIGNLASGTIVYANGSSGTGAISLAGWYQPQGV